MASTLAFPTTVTETMSNAFTSYVPGQSSFSPTCSTSTVTRTATSTLTSTIFSPGQTITYIPQTPPPDLTPPLSSTISITTSPITTITETELVFLLVNPSGQFYTVLTTTIPGHTTSPGPFVFVPEAPHSNGWSSWSDAEKGGLVAASLIIFLLLVAGMAVCLLRNRSVWLASDWARGPVMRENMVAPFQQNVPRGAYY